MTAGELEVDLDASLQGNSRSRAVADDLLRGIRQLPALSQPRWCRPRRMHPPLSRRL
jgi:hypothetical protein